MEDVSELFPPKKETNEQRELIGPVSFAITARIAMQLGRESISNSIVAIIELVKNAYDADADNIRISFYGLDTDDPILVVEDDGNGMSLQQLREIWLVIGTDNKLVTQKSKQKKRILTGEKGLGRLGLDRLCESTSIQTFNKDDNFGTEIEIDWKKYEHTNAKLESIEHQMYQISKQMLDPISRKPSYKANGTRLILRGLKDAWEDHDLRALYNELTLLVSPFSGVNDFSISFFCDTFEELNGKVASENLLDAAEWKVVSTLDFKGNDAFVHHIMSSSIFEATFEFPEITWSTTFQEGTSHIPACGSLRFEFYYIPREDMPILSLKKAQVEKFLNSNQGVRIYRDDFRVMPYGKPSGEGDWLNLGLRRTRSPGSVRGTMGGWKLGYNQVVGAVFIEREKNNALLDQTNREGIVEGPAFYDLRKFALHAIEFFERKRQQFEKAQGVPKDDDFEKARVEIETSTKASIEAVDELKDTVNSVVQILSQASTSSPISENTSFTISSKLTEVYDELAKRITVQQNIQEQLIKAADKREEERQEEFQKQKDTLGNLASLGILSTAFGHETEAASNLMVTNTNELKFHVKDLYWMPPDTLEAITEILEDIEHGAKRIHTFASFTLRNVSRDKRQRTKVYLDTVIKKVFESFSDALSKERNIKISIETSSELPAISAFAIDWESILVNFITNAIYALDDTPESNRNIRVRLHEENNHLHLAFADSGHGLASGTADSIFLPTFSTKRDRRGNVIGTGMGLAIVQNFVESYNGTITVESPGDLGGAEFHIEIPLSKESERRK